MSKKKKSIYEEVNVEQMMRWSPKRVTGKTMDVATCKSHKKAWWHLPCSNMSVGKHIDYTNRASGKENDLITCSEKQVYYWESACCITDY